MKILINGISNSEKFARLKNLTAFIFAAKMLRLHWVITIQRTHYVAIAAKVGS